MKAIALVLIWGGPVYFLFYGLPGSGFNGIADDVFSSSQKGVIGIFNREGNFQDATVHFGGGVNVLDIKISPNDSNLVFVGSDHGLFVSRDAGLNWYNFSDVEHKIDTNTKIYKILFNYSLNPDQAFISAFRDNKGAVYKSEDNFFSLEKIIEFDNEIIYDLAVTNQNLYLGLSSGKLILYSLNNKEFRTVANLNSAITNLQINREGSLIYSTLKSGGLWVSGNSGQSFGRLNISGSVAGINKIYSFLLSPKNSSLIYAATDKGLVQSSDAGNSWQLLKSLPSEKSKISAFTMISNPGEIYAASNGKIYKSNNHGLSWQVLDPNLTTKEISIIEVNNDRIIIGTKK